MFVCKHEEIRTYKTYKSFEIKLIDLWTTTSTSNYATLSSRRSRRDRINITQMDRNVEREFICEQQKKQKRHDQLSHK